MIKVQCPVCESPNELKDNHKEGQRFSCGTCFAQLTIRKIKGKLVAVCALCKKSDMECKVCDERESRRIENDLIL